MSHQCEECGESFPKLSQLLQHRRTENHWRKFNCDVCGKVFGRKNNLERHLQRHRDSTQHQCSDCGKVFSRIDSLQRHKLQHHNQVGGSRMRPAESEDGTLSAKRLRKDDDPHHFFSITKMNEQRMEKFKTTTSNYKITFKDIEVTEDVLTALKRLFEAIFEDLTKGAKSQDLVRLTVQSPSLDYPIVIPFLKIIELTADRFMSEIERVLQSNEDFVIDESLIFEVTLVNMPDGGSRKRCRFVNNDKFLSEKRCVLRIQNDDELCCARAIVTAKAKLEKHVNWESIRKGGKLQGVMAKQLHNKAGVNPGKCGIEDIKKFPSVLTEYQIHVVSKEHFNSIIYAGPESEKKIYLYYHENHYDVISSMAGFLSRSYYCTKCQKGFDHQERHKCNNICHCCRRVHEPCNGDWLHCGQCNCFFRGRECFELHQKVNTKGHSTCKSIYRCTDCGKKINKTLSKKPHSCGDRYCQVCKDFFGENHQCYMIPEECKKGEPMPIEDEIENAKTFIFFDFECRQEDSVECDFGYKPDERGHCQNCSKSNCGVYEHKPNLCVVHKVCTACMDKDSDCEGCGEREHVFRGESTLDDFCTWLFSAENYGSTVICHNFQGYDSYPILQFLYKNAVVPTIIPNGAKIMCLTVESCQIKMIDSINFLPMALAKLPPMFGFEELKKGHFPHLFNRNENENSVLTCLPDVRYYNPDAMKPADRVNFMNWYENHKDDTFHVNKELLEYCRSDVDILRRCCLRFRENFLTITGIDPFERCVTIASACNLVFRTNFLKEETIAIIPHHGYKPEQKQSVKALLWIKYVSHKEGHRIQHARNGGEKAVGPYFVDGYYESQEGEKVVLEFHGDFWHGNPVKYTRSTVNPVNQMTMGELYDKTLEKKKYLEDQGYTYRCIWETEFDQQLNENLEMRSFIEHLDIVTPLEPRDAFYGGRTEAYTLYKEATDDEKIDYYDVTSLYPFINKTGKIPTGHPKIITENFEDIGMYEGLIKCKVLPPRGLFHPVLPCKTNNKLLFHLCQVCAETQQQDGCLHTDEDRAFIGTWVTDEVKKADKTGYKLLKIYEVWHFDTISQYDLVSKSGGLFTEYVNTFLKLKQEASGWPKWCTTDQDKVTYIQKYEEREGIHLDYHNIKKNPGMRALAKLMLNSFWGKFGQRPNMSQVDYVSDPQIYFDKLTSDREEVTAVNYVSDEYVEMRWKYKDDFVASQSKTNVVIAAYTTAQARLKLYSYLQNLGTRALYADTDSVIFSSKKGEWKPVLGDYLGDMTDEVPGNEIQAFVTAGPKNYGYQLLKPDANGNRTECKVRGITLNFRNMSDLNFEIIRQFVTCEPLGKVTVVDPHKITRDRDTAKLLTVTQHKDYRIVFDKRVIGENYVSYPYGF